MSDDGREHEAADDGEVTGASGSDRRRRLATARSMPGDTRDRRGWLRWFGDGDVLARESEDNGGELDAGQPAPPVSDGASRAARTGAVGVALTDLRPAGVASFDGHRVDVVTEGDYLQAGDRVEVLRAERYRRVVRRTTDGNPVRS